MMQSLGVYLIIVYVDTYFLDDVIIIKATLCRCRAVLRVSFVRSMFPLYEAVGLKCTLDKNCVVTLPVLYIKI